MRSQLLLPSLVLVVACGDLLGLEQGVPESSLAGAGGASTNMSATTGPGAGGSVGGAGGEGGDLGGSGGTAGEGGTGPCDDWDTFTSRYHCEVVEDQPSAYWRFALDDPSVFFDDMASEYHASRTEPLAWDPTSLVFADTTGTVETAGGHLTVDKPPEVFDFNQRAPFSVELWAVATTNPDAVNRRALVDNRDITRGWALYIDSAAVGGRVTFERVVAGVPRWAVGDALELGVATHLVGTYDGTFLRIFVNGMQMDGPGDVRDMGQSTDDLLFARSGTSAPAAFHGRLDEIAIYEHALSPRRIAAHYAAGAR